MSDGCTSELMMDHESRITSNKDSTNSAHHRINEMSKVVDAVYKMATSIEILAMEVRTLATSVKDHEEAIVDIKDNMETKDTVLRLYQRLEETDSRHEEGMDSIMESLRKQTKALEEHKQEPAKNALAREKAFLRWLVVGVGTLVFTIVGGFVLIYLGLK